MDRLECKPRTYQNELIKIAIERNSIIFLPTGSGKTFIAVCVLKEFAKNDFEKSYSEGGKISIVIANTVALVQQHAKYFELHTPFKVGYFIGSMGLDYWSQDTWLKQYNDYNILIMTPQILLNNIQSNFIDVSKINLMIFDECHRGVDDHAMRQIMILFQSTDVLPRIVGLTATLLNGNVKSHQVVDQIRKLETTFHAKVATVDDLDYIESFSTNPREKVITFESDDLSELQSTAINLLNSMELKIRKMKKPNETSSNLRNLDNKSYKQYACICLDAAYHIEILGIGGSYIAFICYLVDLNCEKCRSTDPTVRKLLDMMISLFTQLKDMFQKEMADTIKDARLLKYSSKKILKLVQVLQDHNESANEEMCGIIFVQRRNTAVFLYHILKDMLKNFSNFDFIKPDFIIGFTAKPMKSIKESLYLTKMNKKVVDRFKNKEVNLLIASNVIEEGIDVPTCTLVVKFDHPTNYREYIQSKGRARYNTSSYYIMVNQDVSAKFSNSYYNYKNIQEQINRYLIGKNNIRSVPTQQEIEKMYKEIKPYYVNGPGSACVTLKSAISLLMMYCQSLPSDSYTTYNPIFYLEENDVSKYRVLIEMPMLCPINDYIKGDFVSNKNDAKRLAAFNACIILHKMKLLDDNLIPVRKENVLNWMQFLFTHWPETPEDNAGNSKWRVYDKRVPLALEYNIKERCYLHIINLTPVFQDVAVNLAKRVFAELYTNDLSFGIVTSTPLPDICQFPLFMGCGEIRVDLQINQNRYVFTDGQINKIQEFHHLIFNDIVDIIKRFLVIGDGGKNMYVVPVNKHKKDIDFDVINTYKSIKDFSEVPKLENRLQLDMQNLDQYKGNIVIPWYRMEDKQYVVLEVCEYLSADSKFPNEDFLTYKDYFEEKYYNTSIIHPNQPLLRVKALSSGLNCLLPRGKKRTRESEFEDTEMHLIPELCTKQDFPGCLWVQSKLLPSILHRITQLLRAEYLRHRISFEANLGKVDVLPGNRDWEPLKLDMNLIHYEIDVVEEAMQKRRKSVEESEEVITIVESDLGELTANKEFVERIENASYPWSSEQEPMNIYKESTTVNLMDICYYSAFVNEPLVCDASSMFQDVQLQPTRNLAINFNETFEHKPIKLLSLRGNQETELAQIYQALATAKCRDIVNLERLETLGDSYLKLIASMYIFFKFPSINEGESTVVKGRLISNKNLFYLSRNKDLGSLVKMSDFSPSAEWLPPGYCVPPEITKLVLDKQLPITALFNVCPKREEQLSGHLSDETFEMLEPLKCSVDDDLDKNSFSSFCNFLAKQAVRDKTVADVTEALIGVYFSSCGFDGALSFIEWLELIPKSEEIAKLFKQPPKNPIVNPKATEANLDILLSRYTQNMVENTIGYKFKNRAFLLQALTHGSYSTNRITLSYERLEFIGDAVLDFLITTYIYENCTNLDPGKLTDLRSALVNNETFAAFAVRLNLHKHLMYYSSLLNNHIQKFVKYQEAKGHVVNNDVLILLNETDLKLALHADVPKVLGDIFESVVGAIYLDSGMDLNVVWKVIYKIMWKEISQFCANVPKNPIRILMETLAPLYPTFHSAVNVGEDMILVKLDFMLKGSMTRVHGFGRNKNGAKKAAAKIALRLLTPK